MGRTVRAVTDFHAYVFGIAGCAEDFEMFNEFRFDVSIPADGNPHQSFIAERS